MTNRKTYLDYLRVLASIAVIFIHVSAQGWYYADIHGVDWQIFNVWDSFSRWGVPAFAMISGALFLGRKVEISSIYKKYVLRLFVAFLFWGVVYYIFGGNSIKEQVLAFTRPERLDAFCSILTNHYHLWFVPMIAGIYVCIPFIEKIVENKKIMKYFLIVSLAYSFVIPQFVMIVNDFGSEKFKQVINTFNGNILGMDIRMVCGYVSFFVLGYFLDNVEINKKQRMIIYVLGVCGFLFTALATYFSSRRFARPIDNYYSPFTVNILCECVFLFVLFKNLPFKDGKIIKALSKWSFGAYMAHLLIFEKMTTKLGFTTLSLAAWISVPLIGLIVFVGAYLISMILNQIPGLKKYVV